MSFPDTSTNKGKEKLIRLTVFMASLISALIFIAPPSIYAWNRYTTAKLTLLHQVEQIKERLVQVRLTAPLLEQLQQEVSKASFKFSTVQVAITGREPVILGSPFSALDLKTTEVFESGGATYMVTFAVNPLEDTDFLLLTAIVSGWLAVWTYLLIKIIPVRMIKEALEELEISKEGTFQAIKDKELADKTVQLRTMFLANMSHELRTPMNGVLGMIDLAVDTVNEDEKKEYLELAKKSATNLLAILNDILDFSKMDQGKLEVNAIDFNLNDLITILRKTFEISASQKSLRFTLESDNCNWIHADPNRLRQVLTNLIGNAIKFTEKGEVACSVKLQRSAESTALVVAVKDTGIGVSEDSIEKIFSPFSQADSSTTRKFGGTGLGLTISKQLVELMGGSLKVSSVQNQGSTFSFTIPVLIKPVVLAKIDEVAQDVPEAKLRFMIAEDNPINQKLITVILERQQHEVTMVSNGREAVDAFQEGLFDIILMDLEMPVMSGIEATLELRKAGCKIPIVALTAHAVEGFQDKAMAAGMNGFVTKPVSIKAVNKIVQQLVFNKESA